MPPSSHYTAAFYLTKKDQWRPSFGIFLYFAKGGGWSVKNKKLNKTAKRSPPATTPEARENQLISMAVDLAEKQLLEGTASSQVITHFLKLGSSRDRIERENLKEKNKLLKAQTESIKSEKKIEELYSEALNAMRAYSGKDLGYDDEED